MSYSIRPTQNTYNYHKKQMDLEANFYYPGGFFQASPLPVLIIFLFSSLLPFGAGPVLHQNQDAFFHIDV